MMKKLNITNLVDDCTISGGGLKKINEELDRLYEIEKRVGDEKLYEVRETISNAFGSPIRAVYYIGKKEFKSKLIEQLKGDIAKRGEELEEARSEIRNMKDIVERKTKTISSLQGLLVASTRLLDIGKPKKKRSAFWLWAFTPDGELKRFKKH